MFRIGRKGSKRRLHLRSAGRAVWSPRQRRLVVGLVLLFTLPALGWGLVWGYQRLVRYYLLESGRFVLRTIEIQAGDTITSDLVREQLRLREGMPLFALDIAECRREYMHHAATIRSLTITRTLPDRLSVSLVEREPLARLARKPLAVDRDGCVFVRYLGIEILPCISGYPADGLVPGARVAGLAQAALELFELLKNHTLPLQIVDVDVSREDYLDCTMSDQRRVKLAWPRMGENDARSNRLLLAQLNGLAAAMNSARGQGRGTWDATLPGRAYAR
jgi:cell division septal protein FtsQ